MNNKEIQKPEDTRYCYGANCSWFGSIHEVSSTKKHPAHRMFDKMKLKVGDRTLESANFDLPCCPHCGGMLMEVATEEHFFEGVSEYDKEVPGYAKFIEWFKEQHKTKCFKDMRIAASLFKQETGIEIKWPE